MMQSQIIMESLNTLNPRHIVLNLICNVSILLLFPSKNFERYSSASAILVP